MVISPAWHEALIECELEEIRFYAGEIGFFKRFLEKTENEETRQLVNFFITYSEIRMEDANDRLKELRSELEAFKSLHQFN